MVADTATIPTPTKPRRWRRMRWLAKWGGLAASLVIVAAFVASFWLRFGVDHTWGSHPLTRSRSVYINRGVLRWSDWSDFGLPLLHGIHWSAGTPYSYPMEWLPRLGSFWGETIVRIPLWIPFLLCAVPTVILLYGDRASVHRAQVGKCVKCGYDLRGLAPGAVCPECGRASATTREG